MSTDLDKKYPKTRGGKRSRRSSTSANYGGCTYDCECSECQHDRREKEEKRGERDEYWQNYPG